MVNLTIRLSKGPGSATPAPGDGSASLGSSLDPSSNASEAAVTVSCPDHLVLADLPVAKGLGSVSDVTLVKILGRKARRRLGDKVHFCVRCDFPIAIYGRLDPCEHIFCLTCARRDSTCYLCGERVLRIQRMEVLDGIFICGAPRCLRSFIKRHDFQLHVRETHADLLDFTDDKEKTQNYNDSQRGPSSEPQVQASGYTSSSMPVHEQRTGLPQSQTSDSPSLRGTQQKNMSASTLDEKQVKRSEFELQKQQLGHIDKHRRQRQDWQPVEESHFEEQAQADPQVLQPLSQQVQQGMMPLGQSVIPVFTPQPFPPPPYQMHQEGHSMQPMYSYQMPHLVPSPPLPPPRPPTVVPTPPPLMPPPPPKRGKFDQGNAPSDPQVDSQGYLWSGGNPAFDPNRNFGGWPPT